ncbi:MAG: subclass B3 metallo-beta-lactamase, partial [Sphingomonadales bacterium]|nr:subclass B3 metallo-beta-lactamase [Sphingomonadales bacterium]
MPLSALLVLAAAQSPVSALPTPTAPRAAPAGARSPAMTAPAACDGRDGWSEPTVPQRIFANVWYVGTCGISAVLVTSPQGHIVIDGGTRDAGGLVAASIV